MTPPNDQGDMVENQMDATATPMETILKRFQSFRPPILKGTENLVDCEGWLDDIDPLFDSLDYSDDRQIRLVIHQLHGVAKKWWTSTKKAMENRGTLINWILFKTEFYKRFFPVSYRKDKNAEFANLKQAKADQFINGLNPDIFTLVNTERPNKFADAMDHAKGAEAGLIR
ncbi:uncharacterized protein [Henckelia pumila]|uniref:uncharacterized protein n=1 Tax=Henckelia pumila TaxID=405737 RepID=UPI003C6E3CB5